MPHVLLRSKFLGVAGMFAAMFTASEASAQKVAEGPPKVQEIQVVERGFFMEADAGFNLMVNSLNSRSYGLGILSGLYIGYDILPVFSLAIGGVALVASGDVTDPAPRGDLLFLGPALEAQFAVLSTERDFVYVRGGAGFAFATPEEVQGAAFGGSGPFFSATVGYERYTYLRHFSIGVRGGATIVTKPAVGVAISLLPTIKYTF